MNFAATPQMRIAHECERIGRSEVVQRCLDLLAGGEGSPDFVVTVGGAPAQHLLGNGIPSTQAYWLRVWAARGLLWAGPPEDLDALRSALMDESWRVREMTCKVIARYRLGALLEDVAALKSDPTARVRAAADRATTRIVEARA